MGIPADIVHLFPPHTMERIQYLVHADIIARTLLYAAFFLMIWDHMLTFQREIQLVWRARWTVIKVLFLFNRYITALVIASNTWFTSGLVKNLTNEFCQIYIMTTTALELVCISFVSFVVLFRLHAAWGGSRNAFVVLLILWSLSFLASIVVWMMVIYPAKHQIFHEDIFDICFGLVPNLWLQWLPDTILHIIMLIILFWNAIATPRSSRTRMLGLLYREGIVYYSTTLVVLVGGTITWRYADMVWVGVPLYPGWAICQIAMSRLLLSLKSVYAFDSSTDLSSMKPPNRLTRSASPHISVESHGDYALESFKSSAPSHNRVMSPPFMLYHSETAAKDEYRCSGGDQSLRPLETPTSWRSITPEVLSKAERDRRMRERMRSGAYRKRATRWWWWLLGTDSMRREARISVDASTVERWDPGDPGPGVKDSKLGRYDHWL